MRYTTPIKITITAQAESANPTALFAISRAIRKALNVGLVDNELTQVHGEIVIDWKEWAKRTLP